MHSTQKDFIICEFIIYILLMLLVLFYFFFGYGTSSLFFLISLNISSFIWFLNFFRCLNCIPFRSVVFNSFWITVDRVHRYILDKGQTFTEVNSRQYFLEGATVFFFFFKNKLYPLHLKTVCLTQNIELLMKHFLQN